MKGYAIREQMNGIAEAPGKTWFWELEAGVIDAGRCIQCGTCVAVCPSNSIGVNAQRNLPELVRMCTGCSLCWDFCPRGGLRYEALWPPSTLPDETDTGGMPVNGGVPAAAGPVGMPGIGISGAGAAGADADVAVGGGVAVAVAVGRAGAGAGAGAGDGDAGAVAVAVGRGEGSRGRVPLVARSGIADPYWKLTGGPPADGLGAVSAQYAVRAAARPDGAQDGGVVSTILIAALAEGDIDGAVVSVPSRDRDEPWKGVPTVATTAAEIRAAAGSFYNQTMALAELDLGRYDLPAHPRLAVVGTPCEIQGLRAMQARRWPGGTGAHRVDAVVLAIALLCTKSFDYEALMLRELRDRRGVDLDRVAKVDVIHGRMLVEYRDGQMAVDEPIKAFHGAALKGCGECADFVGRCADLSVGSVGSLAGWSSVLVRTEAGRQALERARGRLDLRGLDDPAALERLDALDKRVADRTLRRKLDPDGPMFIEYAEHVACYEGTDRAPVVRAR